MEKRYSIFEAKAKFSEVVRSVLSHGQVVVTQRGVPVIKIVPYTPENDDLAQRLASLEGIGKARRAKKNWPKRLSDAETAEVAAGAVRRFLEERE